LTNCVFEATLSIFEQLRFSSNFSPKNAVAQSCFKNAVASKTQLLQVAQNHSKLLKVAQSYSKLLKVAQSCLKNAVAQSCLKNAAAQSCSAGKR
jgi:hypothetical protein